MECAVFGRLAGAGAAERALKDAAEGVGKYGKIWENVCVCVIMKMCVCVIMG